MDATPQSGEPTLIVGASGAEEPAEETADADYWAADESGVIATTGADDTGQGAVVRPAFTGYDLAMDGGESTSASEADTGTDDTALPPVAGSSRLSLLPDTSDRDLGAELIVNGSFETHQNAGTVGSFTYSAITGWQSVHGGRIGVQTGDYNTGNTVGNSIVEIDNAAGTRDGIQQTFTVTEAGTYQISYDYGVRSLPGLGLTAAQAGYSNAFFVYVDGEIVQLTGSGVNDEFTQGFQHRTFDLDLDAGTHTISFVEGEYTDDGFGAMLDNVSVRQVQTAETGGRLFGNFYYDGDQDGAHDTGEGGIGGQTVYLLNTDQSFVTDSKGEYVTAVTDAGGNFVFEGVDAGDYRVGFVGREASEKGGSLTLHFASTDGTGPDGEPMKASAVVTVSAGETTEGVEQGAIGRESFTELTVCENTTLVKDFNTNCGLMSEDVYFMVANPLCARIGRESFFEDQAQEWPKATTEAVPYHVFLREPAPYDLTFTVAITIDPDKIVYSGSKPIAVAGAAYLTDQQSEIDASRAQVMEVTIKAGQTQSEAFYVGTDVGTRSYVFGLEIEGIYNNDLREACARVATVVTTPIALDLNRDGVIGVTGESTSADKSGLNLGETVHFDMNADGVAERIEWFDGNGDGILIDNRDGNAATDMDGSRLFGDDNGTYTDGYDKLRALFDTDGDGTISGAELDGLALWVDDGDAVVEDGEIRSLDSYSISAVSGTVTTTTDADGRELIRSTVSQDFEAAGNVTYRLEGDDAALFTVDAEGRVSFVDAPDFENPADIDGDNVYEVTLVRITDDPTCKPARENLRIEICDKPSLGDTVWYDSNRDGLMNNGESGAAGVTVNLIDAVSGALVATMTTDANGNYLFDDLMEGDYFVEFVAPGGYTFTTRTPDAPEDVNSDSDADTVTGRTGMISLLEGEHQRNVDAGLVSLDTGTASLGDTVWYDAHGHGAGETGEAGAAGVTVRLIDAETGAVRSTAPTAA
ncbi:SdrD B-like domain-containing protein, partial [Tropicimonas sp.]|uniref:SdrD B-like domain-containing protein n=1 Tax=Tropicimonas sp. TaxID=2067044 RepID=UPI003A85EF66